VVAGLHVRDVRSDGLDDAAGVSADDPGRHDGHARQPLQHEQVEMIERGGAYAQQDVARRANFRHGKVITYLKLLGPAVRRDRQCSHDVECILTAQAEAQ
jgi:hypothetical protein